MAKSIEQQHTEAISLAEQLPVPHVHLRTITRRDLDQPGDRHVVARNTPRNKTSPLYLHAARLILSGEFREATPEEIEEYELEEQLNREAVRQMAAEEKEDRRRA